MNLLELRKHYGSVPLMAQAIDRLDDASTFPGLKTLISDHVVLQLLLLPTFHPMTSWTLFRVPGEASCVLRRVRWDYATDYKTPLLGRASIYGADVLVPAELLSQWLSPLDTLSFPAFKTPEKVVILDGAGFGVRRKHYSQSSEVWWSVPPPGWENLEKWFHEVTAQFDEILPSTSPC